jgi:hypothetical protein
MQRELSGFAPQAKPNDAKIKKRQTFRKEWSACSYANVPDCLTLICVGMQCFIRIQSPPSLASARRAWLNDLRV